MTEYSTYPIYSTLDALSHLDDENFAIACSANEELQMICDGKFKHGHQKFFTQLTDYLYKTRCEAYFDKSLIKFKDDSISWKDFYERLTYLYENMKKPKLANEYAKQGKLMELNILSSLSSPIFPDIEGAKLAALEGNLNVLKWMKEQNLQILDIDVRIYAAAGGKVNILEWMKDNNFPLPEKLDALNATINGHVAVLKWMKENNISSDYQAIGKIALDFKQLNILKWLKENNLPLPNLNNIDLDKLSHNKEIMIWLFDNISDKQSYGFRRLETLLYKLENLI